MGGDARNTFNKITYSHFSESYERRNMDFVEVNSLVKVVARFKSSGNIGMSVMPIKMLYDGREIIFSELGLYHPTTAGKRMVHVFDMSDGGSDYRLEFDSERLTWKLISITSCH